MEPDGPVAASASAAIESLASLNGQQPDLSHEHLVAPGQTGLPESFAAAGIENVTETPARALSKSLYKTRRPASGPVGLPMSANAVGAYNEPSC